MPAPLISCIVPVFNGAAYLREALDSIRAQRYRPLALIVADDGSTDTTADIVARYDLPITYLLQSNAGPAAARNLGLSVATGEYVAFLDADDRWHPDKLARQMAHFQARPQLGYSVTQVRNFWSPEVRPATSDPGVTRPWAGYTCNTLLARRGLFETVGPFDPALPVGEDFDWLLRARERGVAHELLPEVLVYRRLHRGNLTSRLAAESRKVILQRVKAALDRRRARPA